jgi:hypothetical protein
MKKLFNNLLTVYSGTSQNTSPNEKIFNSSLQDSESEALTNEIDTKDTSQNTFTLNIDDIIFSFNRTATTQDPSEISIILPKTKVKKTFYRNEKITSTTEIVLNNLTIIHNPRGGLQSTLTTDNEGGNTQDKPKLKIGFNTDEIVKPPL